MALTGGGANTDLCHHRPRCAHGKKRIASLGPRSSFGCGEWCPLSFGSGLVTEDHHSTRGFLLIVIFGLESHTEGSGIRTLAPR